MARFLLLAVLVAPLVIVAPAACPAQRRMMMASCGSSFSARIRTMRSSKPAARQFCGPSRGIM